VTKQDFADWKRHPVTLEIFSVWKTRRDELIEKLIDITNHGDPRIIAETAASIKVYREILEMIPEDANGY
jgi:hypothetical protein